MLELELVVFSQLLCACEIGWLTFLFKLDLFAKRIFQSALDQIDGEISNVDPNPLATELLRGVNRRAAPAKRIEHHIAGTARCADDALKQRLRCLRWIAKSLLSLRSDRL